MQTLKHICMHIHTYIHMYMCMYACKIMKSFERALPERRVIRTKPTSEHTKKKTTTKKKKQQSWVKQLQSLL